MVKNGIDVSTWQGAVDWQKAGSEIDFVILRLGYGQKSLDGQAKRNISELNRLGIPYGVYWFSYAYTEEMARSEACRAIAYLQELGAKLSYPVYFDWEYDSRKNAAKNGVNVSKTLLRSMAEAFCKEIKAAGYYPGIYANPDYIANHYGEDIFQKYDLWLAHYAVKPSQDAPIWQYSSKGKVAGIEGNVDMNRCVVDYPAMIGKPAAPGAEKEYTATVKIELPVLCKGAKGEQVKPLQYLLHAMGYNIGNNNPFDGVFGPLTDAAVRAYQKKKGLPVTGTVEAKTWATLLGVK